MIRQIMALFDEYQSKENAKHTLRAMKENARQGFWNGAFRPIGYRIVEAAEQRGHRTKKTLEIDPVQAETVRLIFRLAREGNDLRLAVGADIAVARERRQDVIVPKILRPCFVFLRRLANSVSQKRQCLPKTVRAEVRKSRGGKCVLEYLPDRSAAAPVLAV